MIKYTELSIDPDSNWLVITFQTSDKPIWTGCGYIDHGVKQLKKLSKPGREIAQLISALEGTSCVELCSGEQENTVIALPAPDTKLRTLSVGIREVIANYCQCDLGKIAMSEAYDRAIEREMTPPQLAASSDVLFFDSAY